MNHTRYFGKITVSLLCLYFLVNQATACYGKIAKYQPDGKDAERGYFLFTRPVFEMVLPSGYPRPTEVVKEKISFFAVPSEYEPATFLIHALKGLQDVKVYTTDLKSGSNIIPSADIDVRVVKCWEQADPDTGKPRLIPELLVKDDRIQLKGYRSSMPLTPFALTDIPEGTSKQLWITVKTSAETKPGTYSGRIHIQPKNASESSIGLELELLPIKLLPPDKNYSIYFLGSAFGLPWWKEKSDNPQEWEEVCRKELIDLREHGFQSATTYATLKGSTATGKLILDFSNLKKALQLHREAGLTGPTPFEMEYSKIDGRDTLDIRGYPKSAEGRKLFYYTQEKVVAQVEKFNKEQFGGIPQLFYYGVDEANRDPNRGEFANPELAPDYAVGVCKEIFEATRRGGGLNICAVYRSIDYGGFDLLDPLNDLPVYSYGSVYPGTDPEVIRKEAKRKKGVWYYWQCWTENPKENRLMAGLILWKSGASGVMPYCYMSSGGDPYNDFEKGCAKDMNIVYPSREGPVPTLSWEAMREGVDDIRYLTTLAELIKKEKNPGKAQKAKKVIADIIHRVSLIKKGENPDKAQKANKVIEDIMRRVSLNPSEALFDFTEEDLQNFRKKIAQTIIELTK